MNNKEYTGVKTRDNKKIKIMPMTAIQCKSGKTFAGSVTKYIDAEWKLQEAYYKAQGCKVVEVESVAWEGCECEHCESLEHKFEELIEEVRK